MIIFRREGELVCWAMNYSLVTARSTRRAKSTYPERRDHKFSLSLSIIKIEVWLGSKGAYKVGKNECGKEGPMQMQMELPAVASE